MVEFDDWCLENRVFPSEDGISKFLDWKYNKKPELESGKMPSLLEILSSLAFEIYELQVCMEGILEDEEV